MKNNAKKYRNCEVAASGACVRTTLAAFRNPCSAASSAFQPSVPLQGGRHAPLRRLIAAVTARSYDAPTGKAMFRWDAIPEASYYRLEASVDGGITWDVASACFRNTYKTVAGVDASASYVFRVTALNAAKKSIGLYADCAFGPVDADAVLDEAFAGYFDALL